MPSAFRPARLLLLATALAIATGAQAAPTTRRGVFRVVVTIASAGSLPLQTPINATARASINGANGILSAEASQRVQKTADNQVVTINLPYRWILEQPNANVALTVVLNPTLASPAFASSSVSFSVPLPANNATTTVTAPLRL